jgi:hypothetical protein
LSEGVVTQLRLKPKNPSHRVCVYPETQYAFCEKHFLSYSIKANSDRSPVRSEIRYPRRAGECPLCWRARYPPKVRGPSRKQTNTQEEGEGTR